MNYERSVVYMKFVVFLDIDGVLNTRTTCERTPDGYKGIDDARIDILAKVIKKYEIGIYYPYGEFNIMGVYTDERKLLNTYQLLVTEDGRCLKEKFPEMPVIYRIPLNQFLGQQEDCNQMYEIPNWEE